MPEKAPSLGGWVPFSTVDWPGCLAAVAFIAGCPWRCIYCHNPHLQVREESDAWARFVAFLERRRGLLEGVVFSGGEPLSERLLPAMVATVREMGFRVGLHTAGIYPRRLAEVLPQIDWVGLDIKARPADYARITGRRFSTTPVAVSLDLVQAAGCDYECRTTWSPNWFGEADLLDLAQELAGRGVQNYAVQGYRATPHGASTVCLSAAAGQRLAELFPSYHWR